MGQELRLWRIALWQPGALLLDPGAVSHGFLSGRSRHLSGHPVSQEDLSIASHSPVQQSGGTRVSTPPRLWGLALCRPGLALYRGFDTALPRQRLPGNASLGLIGINLLAMAGFPRLKDEKIVLLSNRHLALEKYLNQLLYNAAQAKAETAIEKALRTSDKDSSYPAWSDLYARDVLSRQSHAFGPRLTDILVDTLPAAYVSDPTFDFGVKESNIDLVSELSKQDPGKRARLDGLRSEEHTSEIQSRQY